MMKASEMSYSKVGADLNDEFTLSKYTIWRTIKYTNIEAVSSKNINIDG